MEDTLFNIYLWITALVVFYVGHRLYCRRYVNIKACIVTEGKRMRAPKHYKRIIYGVCYCVNGMKYGCYVLRIGKEVLHKGDHIILSVNRNNHYVTQAPMPLTVVIIQTIALLLSWILMLVVLVSSYL